VAAASGGVFVSVPFGPAPDRRTGAVCVEYSPARGDRFVEALAREIKARAPALRGRTFSTVYLGGCGPSSLSLEQLYRVLQVLYDSVSIVPVEQSMVVLPGTVDPHRAKVLFESGFDRMELRAADAAGAVEHFMTLREAGFRSVGFELSDASDQSDVSDILLRLKPDHLVLAAPPASPLPPEFHEYLPRHFCRQGHECRYLVDFASGRDCIGFGPGAPFQSGGVTLHNHLSYDAWCEAARSGRLVTFRS
jgi:coproporphyrinogen III oxidase-like Fe-S oxidoreductase